MSGVSPILDTWQLSQGACTGGGYKEQTSSLQSKHFPSPHICVFVAQGLLLTRSPTPMSLTHRKSGSGVPKILLKSYHPIYQKADLLQTHDTGPNPHITYFCRLSSGCQVLSRIRRLLSALDDCVHKQVWAEHLPKSAHPPCRTPCQKGSPAAMSKPAQLCVFGHAVRAPPCC